MVPAGRVLVGVPRDYQNQERAHRSKGKGSMESLSISSSTHSKPYVYTSINPKTEIRIIELFQPALPDRDALHCNLTSVKLSDNPSYEALSYAWGEPVFDGRIQVPTGQLAITSTLASALRQLRHPIDRDGFGSMLFVSISKMIMKRVTKCL